ncbi:hypothetical protein AB833_20695 [Chromatiales bacterium (ex Bugula neritina AB1)]|nr:hypothetical protein AB833_20695 [Chromatiales bacterium (ex Bugula neritina AB1)]
MLAVVLAVASVAVLSPFYKAPESIASAMANGQYDQAVSLLKNPALDSHSGAQATLGNMYYLGLGVAQSFQQSAQYYSRAAFAGSTAAQVNLGHLYSSGFGVEQDTPLAYAWFNLAKSNGSRIAPLYMAEMLSEHRLNFRVVEQLQIDYATIKQFTKLH